MQAMADTPRIAWSPPQFVLLPENRSANLAIRRLARCLDAGKPRCSFVPLLLHGPPGGGKSHLCDALHEYVAGRCEVVRVEGSDWGALDEAPRIDDRCCDLLIVEDLQHLPSRGLSAFGSMLDIRIGRRIPTLITASKGPAELANLPMRLASRLAGGLVIGIEAPGMESRRLFLQQRAKLMGLKVREDALDWLARQTPGSGRQLLSALDQLRDLTATLPQLPDAATLQANLPRVSVALDRIAQRVCRLYRIDARLLRGRDRQPGVVLPRQVAMFLARELSGQSLAQVGSYFGRDHTTVGHACQKIADAQEHDRELASCLRQLRAELLG